MKTKQLFTLLLCTIFTTYIYANTLVITRGPVCSGMGNYLSNTINSLDGSYKILSQNDIFNFTYYELFEELFPYQMDIISNSIYPENISYAIIDYHVYFKETANEEEKQDTLNALAEIRESLNQPGNEYIDNARRAAVQYMLMGQLYFHAACGDNIIWESGIFINWENELTSIKQYFTNVIEIITYCPPTTMIQEWRYRNEQAINDKNAVDRRLIKTVLKSFFNCFKPASPDQENIIILTKNEFHNIIEQAAQYIKTIPEDEMGENGIFTRTEFTLEELFDFAEKIYLMLGFENNDEVALASSITYDILLSSKNDCFNFAQNTINS